MLKVHPTGCGITLPDFIVNNTVLNALQKNKQTSKLYFGNLCWCLALHAGCTLQNLESKTKELFLCYCKFALVDPSNFQGATLHDLVQIGYCFLLSVIIYALEWKEQAVAKILQRSRHLFSCATNLNLHENRFTFHKKHAGGHWALCCPDNYSREYIGTGSWTIAPWTGPDVSPAVLLQLL